MNATRRELLAAAAATGTSALAGCFGGDGDAATTTAETTGTTETTETTETTGTTTRSTTDHATPTGTEQTTRTTATTAEATRTTEGGIDHPAAAGLAAQPVLGESDAPALIVAFEDPSCTTCRRFERTTFPKLKSDLVDPGTAAFVYRGVPVVYPWGEPAVQALESTFARDEAAFWALKDHYYAEQDAFTPENTLDRTEEFLASETELDAAAVVADAEETRHDDAVQADLSASSAAGASGVPTFFLFRDGSFRTTITGAQSFDVFASALGV